MSEHKIILRGLFVLDEIAARVEKGQGIDPADIEAALNFMRVFGDQRHQAIEESVLFPVLMDTAAVEERILSHIVFEHGQERTAALELEASLKDRRGVDFVRLANQLASMVRNHIYKEDNILFDIVQKSLSKEQDELVVKGFEKFPQPLQPLEDLGRLEWKYLSKSA